jgi:hypothetical protein
VRIALTDQADPDWLYTLDAHGWLQVVVFAVAIVACVVCVVAIVWSQR